jgi:hypothetical protein
MTLRVPIPNPLSHLAKMFLPCGACQLRTAEKTARVSLWILSRSERIGGSWVLPRLSPSRFKESKL